MLRCQKNSRSACVSENRKPFVFPKESLPLHVEGDQPEEKIEDLPDLASLYISPNRLSDLCDAKGKYLVHLFWPKNEKYFFENIGDFPTCGFWVFKALPGHGVSAGVHSTPVVNFLVANEEFARGYEETACVKKIKHGIVLERSAVEHLAGENGYDFSDVKVKHPSADNIFNPADYWRYDIGRYRIGGMNKLSHATVARLATPIGEEDQLVIVPGKAIIAWW
jgi:hypothetical protein